MKILLAGRNALKCNKSFSAVGAILAKILKTSSLSGPVSIFGRSLICSRSSEIFVNSKHIGGYEDLINLESSKKENLDGLDAIINK